MPSSELSKETPSVTKNKITFFNEKLSVSKDEQTRKFSRVIEKNMKARLSVLSVCTPKIRTSAT